MTYKSGRGPRTRTEKPRVLSPRGIPIPISPPLFGGEYRTRNECPQRHETLSRRSLDPARFALRIKFGSQPRTRTEKHFVLSEVGMPIPIS